MENTIVKFVSLNKVAIETPQGDRFTMGLNRVVPMPLQEQDAKVISYLFDQYYKGDPSVIMGQIYRGMVQYGCWATPYWVGPDRNNERERIGLQIRSLREERNLEVKELASYADIDPSNLSRIEKGKFSASLDILCKIAAAMDCSIELIPNGATSNHYTINRAARAIPDEHKSILITVQESVFHLSECLAKYGQFHWLQKSDEINVGDVVYIYVSEDRAIKYKMTIEQTNAHYDRWMADEEIFWQDKKRCLDESKTKYALLRLVKESHSRKLTEENLLKHGLSETPLETQILEGELLKFIERRF